MPFTPFHFGAGAALHSASPTRVSFLAFCGANVITDIEPLNYMLRGEWPIHRFFHTFLGAAFVAGITIAIGALLLAASRRVALPNYFHWQQVSIPSIAAGAVLGTYTHIILDGMTHIDMKPFAPFSAKNPLLGWMNWWQVQLLCVALGICGGCLLGMRAWRHSKRVL